MKKIKLKTVDSTNDFAKRLLKNVNKPEKYIHATIISDEQTKGRGRENKFYFSPKGDSIFISFILKAPSNLNHPEEITVKSSKILYKTLYGILYKKPLPSNFDFFDKDNELMIKPINDIFYKKKKIVGILTEGIDTKSTGKPDFIILGCGININLDEKIIPDKYKNIIGSLYLSLREKKKLLKELILKISNNF